MRLSDFNGSFEVGFRSDILRRILTFREYEPDVVRIIRTNLDVSRDAIDVGANVGLFTVLLASLVSDSCKVLAIEPTPTALKYLRNNLSRNNRCNSVIVFEGVASSIKSEICLNVIPGKEEYSSIRTMVHPSIESETCGILQVAGETIDELVGRYSLNPGFLKIDTEGSEYEVLLGCKMTLEKNRPIVLCESWDNEILLKAGGSPNAVTDLLISSGYKITRPIKGEILALPSEKT